MSGGWPPDPDWTVVVPLASVTVNVTFNAVSVPPAVEPGPPQVCVNVKFGLAPVWLCETSGAVLVAGGPRVGGGPVHGSRSP